MTNAADNKTMIKGTDGSYTYRGFRMTNIKHRHTIGGDACWTLVRTTGAVDFGQFASRKDARDAADAYWARLGR